MGEGEDDTALEGKRVWARQGHQRWRDSGCRHLQWEDKLLLPMCPP